MSKIGDYKFHEIADIFPMIEGAEYEAFKADVKSRGIRDAIEYWNHPKDGKVYLDGRNRAKAVLDIRKEDGSEDFALPEKEFIGSETEALRHVLSKNFHGRRHLTPSQKAAAAGLAGSLMVLYDRRAKAELFKGVDVAQYLADLLGLNRTYVYKTMRLRRNSIALLRRVLKGDLTIPKAEQEWAEQERQQRIDAGEADPNVTDGTGEPADPRFLKEMAARESFAEVCRLFRQARGAATALANADHGSEYLQAVIDDVTAHLTNAETAVSACTPHAACPACDGEGRISVSGSKRKARCGCCAGKGWVTEALYKAQSQAAAELDASDAETPAGGSGKDDEVVLVAGAADGQGEE